MDEKKKVSRKEILPFVEQISKDVSNLTTSVNAMPECSAKKAFQNSITNLNVKIEKYGSVAERFHVSDEEKQKILEWRKQNEQSASIEASEDSISSTDEESTVSENPKKGKKSKKNN